MPKWNVLSAEFPASAEAFPDIDRRQGIGYLMYVLRIRPDIAYAVNALSTASTPPAAPTKAHRYRLWTSLRYLVSTRTLGLTFQKNGGLTLDAGCDASIGNGVTDEAIGGASARAGG
jgi:hypothetical protein